MGNPEPSLSTFVNLKRKAVIKIKTHVCEVCGKLSFKKLTADGMTVCNKHYRQFRKYGKFLDNNPRTIYDRNEYHIEGDITYIDLYDKRCYVIGQAIIDTEDLDKVKYTKWKLSDFGYVMNAPKFSGSNKYMSREILGVNEFVDHINHNTLDNRKCNLRPVTKSQNQMNVNYKGVTTTSNNTFYAHIKINQKMINLGVYVCEEEALYARWYAETILFGDYRYQNPEPNLPEDRKVSIRQYVDRKVQRL